jgi:hypothetical protein
MRSIACNKEAKLFLRMRSQITFDKETHLQGLPVHQNLKLKTGKPLRQKNLLKITDKENAQKSVVKFLKQK